MKGEIIQKLGGISLMLGSILLLIYSILFPLLLPVHEMRHDLTTVILNPNWIWIAVVAFAGIILMVFGFTAVYSKLYAESGLVGLLGFIFVVIAYLLQACQVTWEIFLYPIIAGILLFNIIRLSAYSEGLRAVRSLSELFSSA